MKQIIILILLVRISAFSTCQPATKPSTLTIFSVPDSVHVEIPEVPYDAAKGSEGCNFTQNVAISTTWKEYEEYSGQNPLNRISYPNPRDSVFIIVEEIPLFNNGDPAIEFLKFIAKKLQYPPGAAEQGISGIVIVRFVVDENGKVINPEVAVSAHPLLDKEAIRVITSSPRWTPGKQKGVNVKVQLTFPLKFIIH